MAPLARVASLAILLVALTAHGHAQAPRVHSVSPRAGPPGTTIHLVLDVDAPVARIMVGGQLLEVLAQSARHVRFALGDASGPVFVVFADGVAEQPGELRVTQPPTIDSVEPSPADPGHPLVLRGSNFELSPLEVFVGDVLVHRFETGAEGSVEIRLPDDAVSGMVAVVTPEGRAERALEVLPRFEITSTVLAGYEPGDSVTVEGIGLREAHPRVELENGDPITSRLTRGGLRFVAPRLPADVDRLGVVIVAADGRRRDARVSVSTPWEYEPSLDSLEVSCGEPGCSVVVLGFGLDLRAGRTRIVCEGRPLEIVRVSRQTIEARISGAPLVGGACQVRSGRLASELPVRSAPTSPPP
jgi:hypothetical protein